jgi:uncharacterized protein (DUF2336 family)
MPRITREIADGLKAIEIAREFFKAAGPDAGELDFELWRLLKAGSSSLRAEMAEQLAPLPNAPSHTVRALACNPNPKVAGPVLRRSTALPDATIAEMARCKGEEHLVAIAARPNLDCHITSILSRRGSVGVLSTLACNNTAGFSTEGLERLRRFCRRPTKSEPATPTAGRISTH